MARPRRMPLRHRLARQPLLHLIARRPVLRRRARPLLRRRARSLLRRRARRILSAFVKIRGQAVKPTVEVFDASHVARMLRSGQGDEAYYYLQCFIQRVPGQDRSPLSKGLLFKVGLFKTLATVAAGGKNGAELAEMILETREELSDDPACARMNKIIAKMHADPVWASNIWQEIEPGQVNKIMDMISRCPELQGDVRLRRERMLLWDPVTRGLCKVPSRRRKNHTPPDVIIRKFLLQKRLLAVQEINGSVAGHSGNLSFNSSAQTTEMEQVDIHPTVPEAEDFPSSTSSSVVLNAKSEQIPPNPDLAAPGPSAPVVTRLLGRTGSLGNEAQMDSGAQDECNVGVDRS